MEKELEEVLYPLTFKVEEIKRLSTKKKLWVSENLNALHIEINFFLIEKDLIQFPYKEAITKLNKIKSTISDLCTSEVEMETLINNIFLIKDVVDVKYALEIIVEELNILISKIDSLIKNVYDSIPPETLLDKTLRLAFFEDLITWTDTHRKQIIEVTGPKKDSEIAEQLYAMYKGNSFKTAHTINFIWEKEVVYYLLHWIAATNKELNKKIFVECHLFQLHGHAIKYNNLRKGVNSFKSKKNDFPLKLLIENYLKPYGKFS